MSLNCEPAVKVGMDTLSEIIYEMVIWLKYP